MIKLNLSKKVQEKIERVYDMFEMAFVQNDELILNRYVSFRLVVDLYPDDGCREITAVEFDYKILSYLSYYCADHNYVKNISKWAEGKLKRWFRTEFTHEELQIIYQKIGAGANIQLGLEFIKSGLDMDILGYKNE